MENMADAFMRGLEFRRQLQEQKLIPNDLIALQQYLQAQQNYPQQVQESINAQNQMQQIASTMNPLLATQMAGALSPTGGIPAMASMPFAQQQLAGAPFRPSVPRQPTLPKFKSQLGQELAGRFLLEQAQASSDGLYGKLPGWWPYATEKVKKRYLESRGGQEYTALPGIMEGMTSEQRKQFVEGKISPKPTYETPEEAIAAASRLAESQYKAVPQLGPKGKGYNLQIEEKEPISSTEREAISGLNEARNMLDKIDKLKSPSFVGPFDEWYYENIGSKTDIPFIRSSGKEAEFRLYARLIKEQFARMRLEKRLSDEEYSRISPDILNTAKSYTDFKAKLGAMKEMTNMMINEKLEVMRETGLRTLPQNKSKLDIMREEVFGK